jgi:hypothetical protein
VQSRSRRSLLRFASPSERLDQLLRTMAARLRRDVLHQHAGRQSHVQLKGCDSSRAAFLASRQIVDTPRYAPSSRTGLLRHPFGTPVCLCTCRSIERSAAWPSLAHGGTDGVAGGGGNATCAVSTRSPADSAAERISHDSKRASRSRTRSRASEPLEPLPTLRSTLA